MKDKKNIFQSIQKEFKKGYRRIFWFIYSQIKYIYLTSKFNKIKDIREFKISILLPTRERSIKFKRMLDSLMDTCKFINRIELLMLLDEDDKQHRQYEEIINDKKYKNLYIKIFIINLPTQPKRINYLASKSSGYILFPFNDDVVFKSLNWDYEIDLEFSKVKNEPYCLWIDNGQKYLYLHTDFPIVNRIWFEKLGYITKELFYFWYTDNWICDLCFKTKKFLISKNIKLFQYSANTYVDEVDDTYLRNVKNNIPEKDKIIWNQTKQNRIDDAKLLK